MSTKVVIIGSQGRMGQALIGCAKRLPEVGKGLGEGLKGFREGSKGVTDPPPPAPPVQQQNVSAPPPITNTPIEPK